MPVGDGDLDVFQSNGAVVNLHIRVDGTPWGNFTGIAGLNYAESSGTVTGQHVGLTTDPTNPIGLLQMTINWQRGPVGVYYGMFNADGHLTGIRFEQNRPNTQATWYSDGSHPVC